MDILGEGGMGRVHRARIEGPDGFRKDVALKVLRPDRDWESGDLGASLAKEARIGALLRHPNLVDLYDFGVEDGRPWFSMELVPGRSLDRILAEAGPLPPARARHLLSQIALGLAAIHELSVDGTTAGLVHRDLKPANVLVTPDDHVKLADFGIARGSHALTATNTDSLRGTPAYMSPEQARSAELDARSDLFSLGLIGWELLTGRRFLGGSTVFEVMFGLLKVEERQEEVRALDATFPGFGSLLADCLREDRDDRPATARDVRARLADLALAGGPRRADASLATTLEAPAVSSPVELTGNLRPALDSFVGRSEELDALRAALSEPGRVVSLVGPGGTGKTRLAQELGLSVRDEFPGGAWFVDLTASVTRDGACSAVAQVLGIPLRSGSEPSARIGAALGGRGKVLLLLDNFEQIQRFAPDTVGAWAQACPDARFVVTTRQRLALGAEKVVRVGPLRAPVSGSTPEELGASPAVQLFVDRAQRSRPNFELTAESAATIGELVRALDGIPLAIELAAARVRVMSVQRLLERLPQRFDLLSTGRTDVTGRQATLRATIDWSWTLLEPWEQTGLAQASVFRGGFSVEAAEAVFDLTGHADAPWTLDVVQALEDKSLLRSVVSTSGDVRFVHYESIREFAAEKLESDGDADSAERRHLTHFAALGRPEAVDSLSTRGSPARRRRWTEDLENLTLVVDRALARGLSDLAANGALAVSELLAHVGPFSFPRSLLERVRGAPGLSPVQTVRVLLAKGQFQSLAADYADAEETLAAAEGMATALGEKLLEGIAWAERGRLHLNSPDTGQGAHLERARARFAELGDVRREGAVLCSIAVRASTAGRYQEARTHNEEALLKLKSTGDQMASLVALGNLAISYKEVGMVVLELAALNEALRIARELGAARYEAVILVNLGVHHQVLGRLRRAEELYEQASAIAREIGLTEVVGITLGNLGDVLKDQGRLVEARGVLQRAVALARKTDNVRHLTGQLMELAQVLLGLGELADARVCIQESRELAATLGNPRHVGEAEICAAHLDRLNGDASAATAHLDAAEEALATVLEPRFLLRARLERLEGILAAEDLSGALDLAVEIDTPVRTLQEPLMLASLLSARARAQRGLEMAEAEESTAELSDLLDGIELAPEAPLRRLLAVLKGRR